MRPSPKTLTKALARGLAAGVGRILPARTGPRALCYHGLCDEPTDEWSLTPERFRRQMETVARRFEPVSIQRLVSWAQGREDLPGHAVTVTFDDGFLDVLSLAAPIMAEFGVPGTVFVSTELASRGAAAADPGFEVNRPLMDWNQVRELSEAGWTVGSHGRTHARLSRLDEARALDEIRGSKEAIEDNLGLDCRILAYPFGTPGAVARRDSRLASDAGYEAAFMAVTGPVDRGVADPFRLPRSKVLGTDGDGVVKATLAGRMDHWALVEKRH